jgi:phosphoribosylaminoimidazolecarboxamide formyltransferase / IMP cyclohydrolase
MSINQPLKRALLSVSDKTGLIPFAKGLLEHGVSLVSTGGTYTALKDANLAVEAVDSITGFPEILEGRVKTLHPNIHGGILAKRTDPLHQQHLKKHNITPIDLVVVNLYPFAATRKAGANWLSCIEQIDVGGPTMLRAAAKNYHDVVVACCPSQYPSIINELSGLHGCTSLELREALASEAFQHTAYYDAMISEAFNQHRGEDFPKTASVCGQLRQVLRYGENPHQRAAFYAMDTTIPGVTNAQQLQGKELSYNNVADTNAAFELVSEFAEPAAAVIKHANPCGVALGKTLSEAYKAAVQADSVSAYGGIVALNRELDKHTAQELSQLFVEVVIAPSIHREAEVILTARKNLRVLITGGMPDAKRIGWQYTSVAGGILVQERDTLITTEPQFQVVTTRTPTAAEERDLRFAFTIAKHVKSNAIIYAKDLTTVGIGAGQMSRVDAARIAAAKAAELANAQGLKTPRTVGSVVASDAFFPFADGLQTAIAAGATAVIQPGGAMRDDEVIAAANAHNIAMVFTGVRHFKH